MTDTDGTTDTPSGDRRRHERLKTRGLLCLLGEVLDVSEGGALIHHRGRQDRKIGECFTAMLRHESHTVVVQMRLARIEKVGYRRHNYGVEFVGLDDHQRAEIGLMADAGHDAFIGPQAYVE